MFAWPMRFDAVVVAVWEIWTNNGWSLDEDDQEQTRKSVCDAVANVYQEDMTDKVWVEASLARLKGTGSC